jgi:hypothetical protein
MPTPSIVPNNEGEGQIGTSDKRWASGFFRGHLNVRGQDVTLKYFVADAATRFALTGLGTEFRPSAGDIVFQYSPTGLFIVLDETLLSNESGYRPFGQTVTSLFTNPILYGTVNLASGSTGHVLYLDSGNNIAYSPVTSGDLITLSGITGNIQAQLNGISTGYAPINSPVFLNQIKTPQLYVTGVTGSIVPYLDNSGKLTASQVTILDFNFVSGATGNVQGQINSLRSGNLAAVVTGINVTGLTLTGKVILTGIGGLVVSTSGQNILFSGGAGGGGGAVITGTWPVVLNTYDFPSGSTSSTFISFGYTFGAVPKVFGTLWNNSGDPILGYEISGTNTTGFYLVLSDTAVSNNYHFDYFATTGSGILNLGFGSADNLVYTTGDQNISGEKLFFNNIGADVILPVSDTDLRIDVFGRQLYDATPSPSLDWGAYQLSDGGPTLDWSARSLTGTWDSNGLKINGKVVPSGSGTVNKIVLWGAQSGIADSVIAQSGSKIGIGTQTPRAFLHLPSGGTGIESAPLKFTSGNLMTTGEPGSIEWTSSGLFFTDGATGRSAIVMSSQTGQFYPNTNPSGYSAAGLSLTFVGIAANSPATGTTYYLGPDASVALNTVYDNAKIEIPKSGTIKRFWFKVRITGTLAATGLVQHFLRLNDTTDFASGSMDYTGTVQHLVVTTNQTVNAGDYIAIKQVTPAWTGLPTTVRYYGTVYME